jgi:hypothetical protein
MKKTLDRTAPLVVGFVIGALLTAGGPATAKRPSGPRALARQMAALELRVFEMEQTAAASAEAVEARLEELESLTQLLDHDGSYVGYVDSVQVWSSYCEAGAEAIWIDYDGYPELSCVGEGAAPRRAVPNQSSGDSSSPEGDN